MSDGDAVVLSPTDKLRDGQRARTDAPSPGLVFGHACRPPVIVMAITLDIALAHLTSRKRQTLVSVTGVVLGVAFFWRSPG